MRIGSRAFGSPSQSDAGFFNHVTRTGSNLLPATSPSADSPRQGSSCSRSGSGPRDTASEPKSAIWESCPRMYRNRAVSSSDTVLGALPASTGTWAGCGGGCAGAEEVAAGRRPRSKASRGTFPRMYCTTASDIMMREERWGPCVSRPRLLYVLRRGVDAGPSCVTSFIPHCCEHKRETFDNRPHTERGGSNSEGSQQEGANNMTGERELPRDITDCGRPRPGPSSCPSPRPR
jgi:hypothetical protein